MLPRWANGKNKSWNVTTKGYSYKSPLKCYRLWPHPWLHCDTSWLSSAIEAYFYREGIIFRYISHSRQSNTSNTLVQNHWGNTISDVLNFFLTNLMVCDSVAGNGCHKTCRNKTRLITDPWWHSCICWDFIDFIVFFQLIWESMCSDRQASLMRKAKSNIQVCWPKQKNPRTLL